MLLFQFYVSVYYLNHIFRFNSFFHIVHNINDSPQFDSFKFCLKIKHINLRCLLILLYFRCGVQAPKELFSMGATVLIALTVPAPWLCRVCFFLFYVNVFLTLLRYYTINSCDKDTGSYLYGFYLFIRRIFLFNR